MSEEIKVGMADLNVCKSPDSIITLGLGSCVGVILWDPVTKVCGMVHVMLPDSTSIRNNSNLAKFADTGIEELLRRVIAIGANRSRIVSKIAGGAQMFALSSKNDLMRVGERNTASCKAKLRELKIPLKAEDTGDSYGRTVTFYPESGEYHIRTVGKGIKVI